VDQRLTGADRQGAGVIGFAHRGGRALAPDNSERAFALALERGVRGLETDVWLSADGVCVLDHDGRTGRWPQRRPIAEQLAAQLPRHLLTLEAFYRRFGTDFELSVDIKSPVAARAVLACAAAVHGVDRLWLCHPDVGLLSASKAAAPQVHLVQSVRRSSVTEGPEARARALAAAGVEALNLQAREWDPAWVRALHAAGVACFAWDAQRVVVIQDLVRLGIDGVYCDDPDTLAAGLGGATGSRSG
jgi:glycerophosphoryl diester phosphodiesterase